MHRIRILCGDITALDVDVIVNAANERMLGGGGVDGAIHRAAGPKLLEACRSVPEVKPGVRCPVGESRLTPGFDLPARYVIHTVGPVWAGGEAGEPDLLGKCYRGALELARDRGCRSIAFPAISCGVYGYPPTKAASVAVGAVSEFLAEDDSLEQVVLVAFDSAMESTLRAVLQSFVGVAKGRSILRTPDIADTKALLDRVDLPASDLNSAMLQHFLGAYSDDELIAVGGLEVYDRYALLRSLATAPTYRKQGLASWIIAALEDHARRAGVSDLYLLTDTAESYFASRGFARIGRDAAPAGIASSLQFCELCLADAALMHKTLSP